MAGSVTVIPKECDVEWKMNFTSLSEKVDANFCSPIFSFEGECWQLVIWPNGRKDRNSAEFIDLRLRQIGSINPPINMQIHFSLKTVNGEKEFKRRITGVFERGRVHDVDRFLSKSEFEKRQSEFSASGLLTVVCTLKSLNSTGSSTAEYSLCNEIFEADEILSHKKKSRIRCPECLDVVVLKNWQDHECAISRTEASENMLHDFKTVMLSGDHSDTIIRVKGEEFKLHKVILSARNLYFNSMFKNDMKEKSTGIVTIEDCEPDIFRSFIHFLYTEKLDKLSPENVCNLYKTADKYQEDKLRKECLHFMMNTVSVHNFCDYLILSLRHDEKELFLKCLEFFITKRKEIASSVEWQVLVKEYPLQTNEFLMKVLDQFDW